MPQEQVFRPQDNNKALIFFKNLKCRQGHMVFTCCCKIMTDDYVIVFTSMHGQEMWNWTSDEC